MKVFSRRHFALLAAASLALWQGAEAHGPTRQKVVETMVINATPDVVWAKVKDFNNLQGWHPAIESSTTSDGNNLGSERVLTLKGGAKIVETLEKYSEESRSFAYRMKDPGPVPVGNYSSTLTVKDGPTAGTSEVEWRGAFYRGYPNNNPPPELSDEAAVNAVTGIYKAGLENLKKLLEK